MKIASLPLFLLLILAVCGGIFWQCSEKQPPEITRFEIEEALSDSLFLRDSLKSDGDYSTGYRRGHIRSDRVTLFWKPYQGENFLNYRIYRNDRMLTTITDPATTQFTDSNLVQNTVYHYKMILMLRNGLFTTDTISIRTPLFLPPRIIRFDLISSNSIRLYWQNRAETAEHYRVYRKLQEEPESSYQVVGTTEDTVFVDQTVENFTAYHYRVSAYNNFETTAMSEPFLVFLNYILNPPHLLSVQQFRVGRYVWLRWEEDSNMEDGFRIYRSADGVQYDLIEELPANATEFVDTDTVNGLQVGSTYYYYVTAFNEVEETSPSNMQSVTITVVPDFIGIGTPDEEWDYPFYTHYSYVRTQILYLASEIQGPVYVKGVAFYVTKIPGEVMHNFVIRLKHTTLNVYPDAAFDNEGYTICFNQTMEINSEGWVKIPFDTVFIYNGVDNLIVDVSFANYGWSSGGKCWAMRTSESRTLYWRQDVYTGDVLNWEYCSWTTLVPIIRLYSY